MDRSPRRPRHAGRRLATRLGLPLGLVATLLAALPASAAAADFPAGWEGFHTYAEVGADVAAVAAAHPAIVRRFSIGKSYEGRDLWAAKISDNVTVDENEPEVYFDGGTHADEHMGVEMTLKILHWLADGYGKDARITRLVDTREVWIVFSVNPDGAAYDIKYGKFHYWRKNRQPTPGSKYIGTDLNRNYDYRWGTAEGRTSTNPQAITYRGPHAFSAPETQAVRAFLKSRVVGGRQQIRTAITFHETGRLVMWPYGYTYADVPSDMTRDDHVALYRIGKAMAATNRYRPEQASDLYLTSGTTRDYLYGIWRVFSFTFEMSVKDYVDDSLISSETGRNKEAVLSLIDRSWCPLAVLGEPTRTARCGPFDDDLEVSRGWTVDAYGTDTAPVSARWNRGDPASTSAAGVAMQLGSAVSGSRDFSTGLAAGSSSNSYDLDGVSTIRSTPFTLASSGHQQLSFRWSFAHDGHSTSADSLKAIVEVEGGAKTVVFTRSGTGAVAKGGWRAASIPLDAWHGQTIRIAFAAADGGADNLVEASLDDVRVTLPTS